MTNDSTAPFFLRPGKKKPERIPAAPSTAPLHPCDKQAALAAHEEQSALDVLERDDGTRIGLMTLRRPAPGVREIAAYDIGGRLLGVSTVYGFTNEEH